MQNTPTTSRPPPYTDVNPTPTKRPRPSPTTTPNTQIRTSLPSTIPPTIASLSLHSLRVELQRRNLPTSGPLSTLRTRLHTHLHHHPSFITVPQNFPATPATTPSPPHPTPPFTKFLPPTLPKAATPSPLPANASATGKARGVLRGHSVWVCNHDNIRRLLDDTGLIGKANLSRSTPGYHTPPTRRTTLGRAARQLAQLQNHPNPQSPSTAPRHNIEHQQLTLIEAYYAAFVTKTLTLYDTNNSPLSNPATVWSLFCTLQSPTPPTSFAATFVAYARYRSVGWLPRSGLKYGADWVLYPDSYHPRPDAPHNHASYCVMLRQRTTSQAPLPLDRSWIALQNRIRLVQNVAKTLVVTDLTIDANINVAASVRNAFKAVSVSELTVGRWTP